MVSTTGTVGVPKPNSFEPSDETVAMLKERAQFIRLETVRLIEIAKTGHYTSVFSAAEIFAALYYDVMRIRRGEPNWTSRDRFTIGKGHAAVGLFPIYADLDFSPLTGSTTIPVLVVRSVIIPICARFLAWIFRPAQSVMRFPMGLVWSWRNAGLGRTTRSSA